MKHFLHAMLQLQASYGLGQNRKILREDRYIINYRSPLNLSVFFYILVSFVVKIKFTLAIYIAHHHWRRQSCVVPSRPIKKRVFFSTLLYIYIYMFLIQTFLLRYFITRCVNNFKQRSRRVFSLVLFSLMIYNT